MAARKKGAKAKAKATDPMIISKSRVKGAVKKCNIGSEFYSALENEVRSLISRAEDRALANKRKTLRPADV